MKVLNDKKLLIIKTLESINTSYYYFFYKSVLGWRAEILPLMEIKQKMLILEIENKDNLNNCSSV